MGFISQKSSPHGLLHMMYVGFQRVAGRGKPQCSLCLHHIHNGLLTKTNGKVEPRFKGWRNRLYFLMGGSSKSLQREWKQGFENLWLFCKALCKYCHFVNNLLSYFPLFPFPFILIFLTLLLSFASGYLFLKWRARSLSYLL